MRDRHWSDISKNLGFEITPDDNFTLSKVIELRLSDYLEMIQKVAESAAKEYQIEQVRPSRPCVRRSLRVMPLTASLRRCDVMVGSG